MNELRLLLIADDPLARAGLAALLADDPACDVVMQGAVDDATQLSMSALAAVDVVLWDLGWSATSDLSGLADLAQTEVPLAVLVPDDEAAGSVWAAGARGLLLRDGASAQLAAALQAVAQGLVVVDPALTDALPVSRAAAEQALILDELTPRETEVLHLLAQGAANKEIARRLAISENTVKYHVNAILGKLGAQSRTEAVVRATRAGLILL